MDSLKVYKIANWIAYGIIAAFIVVFIILCISVGAKNKTIKGYKQQLKAQTEEYADIQAYADSLAKLECVTISNTIVVNQRGLINTTAANNISKTVATYTREELLNALDSLNKTR